MLSRCAPSDRRDDCHVFGYLPTARSASLLPLSAIILRHCSHVLLGAARVLAVTRSTELESLCRLDLVERVRREPSHRLHQARHALHRGQGFHQRATAPMLRSCCCARGRVACAYAVVDGLRWTRSTACASAAASRGAARCLDVPIDHI